MRRFIVLILLWQLDLLVVAAQQDQRIARVKVNTNILVMMFFPENIQQAIPGNDNFSFVFDKKGSKYGMLQGRKGKPTNLTVITKDGNIYSFMLEHEDGDIQTNYFIEYEDAVGNLEGDIIKREERSVVVAEKDSLTVRNSYKSEGTVVAKGYKRMYEEEKERYYERFCSNEMTKSPYFRRVISKYERIVLSLHNITFNKEELYFTLDLQNSSGIDYEVNFIKFFKVADRSGKRASAQSIEYPVVHSHNPFTRVRQGERRRAIYVFERFSIGKDRKFLIELREVSGERTVQLYLDSRIINNPN